MPSDSTGPSLADPATWGAAALLPPRTWPLCEACGCPITDGGDWCRWCRTEDDDEQEDDR